MRTLTYLDAPVDEAGLFLGAVLYDNRLILDGEWLQIPPEFFEKPLHQKMWKLMSEAGAQGKLVDPIWLSGALEGDPDFEAVEGVRYLADLIDLGSEVRDLQSALALLTLKLARLTNHRARHMLQT
jgi:replicative DNA helicase